MRILEFLDSLDSSPAFNPAHPVILSHHPVILSLHGTTALADPGNPDTGRAPFAGRLHSLLFQARIETHGLRSREKINPVGAG